MNHIASALNGTSRTLSKYLKSGTYYYSVEYSDNTLSGTINTNIHVHSYEYKVVDLEHHILISEMESINEMLINSTAQYSLNGSYKLADGTIILVEEDVIAFRDGTLVFYSDDKSLVRFQPRSKVDDGNTDGHRIT